MTSNDLVWWMGLGIWMLVIVVCVATWRWAWFHKPPSTGIRKFQEQERDPRDDWKN